MTDEPPFFVITGGPGAGKTTLVEVLCRRGITIRPEAGRAIIRQRKLIDAAPRGGDPYLFAELMLTLDLHHYETAPMRSGPVIFDRGLPDLVGYLQMASGAVPAHFEAAARRYRYNTTVFLAPFWHEIFAQDDERDQSPDEARRTAETMSKVYEDFGYRIVELPMADVEARSDFVERHIARRTSA